MPPELAPTNHNDEVLVYSEIQRARERASSTNREKNGFPSTLNVKQNEQRQQHASLSTLILQRDEQRQGKMVKNHDYSSLLHRILPPISKEDLPKFSALSLLNFFIIFVLTLTRDLKDTLVVTYIGAESIAFLKIYFVLPMAFLQVYWYNVLSGLCGNSKQTLWYATGIPFFAFFVSYCTVIHPNAEFLHEFAEEYILKNASMYMSVLANNESVFYKILKNWTVAMFYVGTELYSSVSVGILFWKLANDVVVDPAQAKRFYPLFSYMSSFGPIVAGQFCVLYASQTDDFQSSLNRIGTAIGGAAIIICFLHHLLMSSANDNVTQSSKQSKKVKVKKTKPSMSMKDSVKFLANSEYLCSIATLVIGYGVMYNFIELSWKSIVKLQYQDPIEYQRYMGNFSSTVGFFTFFVIFLGTHVLNNFGWKIGALATPITMALFALPFFGCLIFLDVKTSNESASIAVPVATILVLLSRSFKYGLFDATTQMTYIPLDEESKIKGKAAIDVLGSRIGKSGASFIQQGLVLWFGDILNAAPIVAMIFYAMAYGWIRKAHRLSFLYGNKVKAMNGKKR